VARSRLIGWMLWLHLSLRFLNRFSDYCPISVTPLISRLTERIIVQRWILPSVPPDMLRDQYAFKTYWKYNCSPYLLSGPFLLLEMRGTIWGWFAWSHLWLLYTSVTSAVYMCTCVLACVAGRSFNTWTTKVLLPGQLDSVCLCLFMTLYRYAGPVSGQSCEGNYKSCLWVRQQDCSTKVFGECVWPVLTSFYSCVEL